MKKISTIILTGVMAVGLITGCSNNKSKNTANDNKKVLVMATSADYKPFEYMDTTKGNTIIGLDVDLAKYIAKDLGYTLQVKDMDFNSLITAVKTGKVDMVASGMTPTEARKKSVDFTDVYYSAKN